MQFVFWQNILSPHQAPFLRELAGMGHESTIVAPEVMSADRVALGWQAPDMGLAKVIIAPDSDAIRDLVMGSHKETIHIMAGARWTRLGYEAAHWCMAGHRCMGVLTESPDPHGWGQVGRRIKYTTERIIKGQHYDFILAMGEIGVRWFRGCGYPVKRIFPFAYVTEKCHYDIHKEEAGPSVRILYAGQLIHRKGVDILFHALANTPMCELSLIGNGPDEQALRLLAGQLGIADRISWFGAMPAAQIPAKMAIADVFVLPSRRDGWGAVVNEALMVGTPVICSSTCGAADLIQHDWLGTVFRAESVNELTTALQYWSKLGRRKPEERDHIRDWSQAIQGKAMAEYFIRIMRSVYEGATTPSAPWRYGYTPARITDSIISDFRSPPSTLPSIPAPVANVCSPLSPPGSPQHTTGLSILHIVFWQNILSPHQAPFLRELAGMGHKVTIVAPELMTADRSAMGWQAPDMGLARVIIAPDSTTIRGLVANGHKETIHVMAGARWTRLGHEAEKWCIAGRRRMGLLTEAPDPRGLAGVCRRVKYVAERITKGQHYDFILAMGEMGVRWFRGCGYPATVPFPFAYVTEHYRLSRSERLEDEGPGTVDTDHSSICILYVGRLIKLKAVDLLLRAFAKIPSGGIKLQIVGNGLEEKSLRELASSLGIAESVEWLGQKNSDEIPALMGKGDVMILPSHKDGWGAVVNEALMVGTPVICSSSCGAAELIQHEWLGTVVPAGDVTRLAAALHDWTRERLPDHKRRRIRDWSQTIQGRSVAEYIVRIMRHIYEGTPRPIAPWRP